MKYKRDSYLCIDSIKTKFLLIYWLSTHNKPSLLVLRAFLGSGQNLLNSDICSNPTKLMSIGCHAADYQLFSGCSCWLDCGLDLTGHAFPTHRCKRVATKFRGKDRLAVCVHAISGDYISSKCAASVA